MSGTFAGNNNDNKEHEIYKEAIGDYSKYGEFRLGENTSRIMAEDPRHLVFTLSRYKFVSKMFNGFESVLEVGCQEAFGGQLVAHEVGRYHGVDFFLPYIESCQKRLSYKKNMTFEAGDILDGNISGQFDGIFALDVFEHIQKSKEHIFLNNIKKMLNEDGVMILGVPSLESQKYASEGSKLGHVNCKTAEDLKKLVHEYYKNTFIFSMNDEVLHTGFYPMSHYLFVIACNKR